MERLISDSLSAEQIIKRFIVYLVSLGYRKFQIGDLLERNAVETLILRIFGNTFTNLRDNIFWKGTIKNMLEMNLTVQDIIDNLKKKNPDLLLTPRGIWNSTKRLNLKSKKF